MEYSVKRITLNHFSQEFTNRLLEVNNKKERYLSQDEAKRLYDAVCVSENAMLKFIVPMLILTGARKREVLDAKWTDFDLERRIWRIPTTKAGKARHVPLADGVMHLLSTMPRDSQWVFPNADTSKNPLSPFIVRGTPQEPRQA